MRQKGPFGPVCVQTGSPAGHVMERDPPLALVSKEGEGGGVCEERVPFFVDRLARPTQLLGRGMCRSAHLSLSLCYEGRSKRHAHQSLEGETDCWLIAHRTRAAPAEMKGSFGSFLLVSSLVVAAWWFRRRRRDRIASPPLPPGRSSNWCFCTSEHRNVADIRYHGPVAWGFQWLTGLVNSFFFFLFSSGGCGCLTGVGPAPPSPYPGACSFFFFLFFSLLVGLLFSSLSTPCSGYRT